MRIEQRNNIRINEAVSPANGANTATIVFAHGFGCDQTMWRYLEPMFRDRYRTVLFDLVGCGKSDLSAYDFDSYTSLHAHAGDLLEVINAVGDGPVICIGHSVSSMIGPAGLDRRTAALCRADHGGAVAMLYRRP